MQIRLRKSVKGLLDEEVAKINRRTPTAAEVALGYRLTSVTELANEILFCALQHGNLNKLKR